jgi:hypothetical protein
MQTNTILDDAERRLAPAAATAQTRLQEIIEAMREEIGRQHYDQAQGQLVELERVIAHTYRPFLNRVGTIAAKSKAPLPAQVQGWLTELATSCDQSPQQVRRGIEAYTTLQVPIWKDGKTVHEHMRRELVGRIRQDLRCWDGMRRFMEQRKGQVEEHIKHTGWPAARPMI